MSTVPVEEVERNPSRYLSQVEAGEKLVLTRAGQPFAVITPVVPVEAGSSGADAVPAENQLRPIGLAEGLFMEAADFDAPLPEEYLRLFEGQ